MSIVSSVSFVRDALSASAGTGRKRDGRRTKECLFTRQSVVIVQSLSWIAGAFLRLDFPAAIQ